MLIIGFPTVYMADFAKLSPEGSVPQQYEK